MIKVAMLEQFKLIVIAVNTFIEFVVNQPNK